MSIEKKEHRGPPQVECWFCNKRVFKKRTARFPNNARVCKHHQCEYCGDFIRPDKAVVLVVEKVDYAGNSIRTLEHVCNYHRRYIVEQKRRDRAEMLPYHEVY